MRPLRILLLVLALALALVPAVGCNGAQEPTAPTEPAAPTEPSAPTEPTAPPEPAAPTEAAGEATPAEGEEVDLVAMGEGIFATQCAGCHGQDGQGVPGTYPALAGSPVATAEDPTGAIRQVVNGGGGMPAYGDILSDEEIASVLSYVRNSFGNEASLVQPEDVEAVRAP